MFGGEMHAEQIQMRKRQEEKGGGKKKKKKEKKNPTKICPVEIQLRVPVWCKTLQSLKNQSREGVSLQ